MTATLIQHAPSHARPSRFHSAAKAGPSNIFEKEVLFVGGKGGAGKTTLAAALALAVAARHPDRRVLLLSTDPAHSLKNALADAIQQPSPFPNLKVVELKAERAFEEFRARHREGLRKIALRGTFLEESDLDHFLDAGLPGLDELAALKVIAETVKTGQAEHLIVDTAPTGHTLRLLALPEIIGQWREALDALMAKHRLMASLYAKRQTPDEADALVAELRDIHTLFRETLEDPERAAFVAVMNPDPLSVYETHRLYAALEKLKVAVPCILLNRVQAASKFCQVCGQLHAKETEWLKKARAELHCRFIEIPRLPFEPRGAQALSALGRFLLEGETPFWELQRPARSTGGAKRSSAVNAGIHAAPSAPNAIFKKASVILVCGKGGVGKTTVASALALHLAGNAGARVLLFSTDPAHSLSDAFGRRIGPEPTPIVGGLDAVEVDAAGRLAALRETYRRETGAFCASLFRTELLDATLDREAMERLIDLSPPGLDEIMALTELSRYVPAHKYDKFVIDTPPTGHFLRFLELPELMRAWLRAFFEIFLKYKNVLRVPGIQALLVKLSKEIRELQALLADRENTLVLPVAIPTALAFEQTRNLLRRLEQLGMAASLGVLNRLSWPGNGCANCAGRAEQTRHYLERYRETFANLNFLSLEEQTQDITGPAALGRIGNSLFA